MKNPPVSHRTPGTVVPVERDTNEPHAAWLATKKARCLRVLWDMDWYSTQELVNRVGHRFGASIHQLRRDGWQIETKEQAYGHGASMYRLQSQEKGPPIAGKVRLYLSPQSVELLAKGVVTHEARQHAQEILRERD